eukprot:TRINITY_DN9091_c0_g1_i1.p1 TRINITY_DN9091_c0_g1~~TRINITY_DN9091_c0_g1_i1.p1  ORF type:complete len:491 (+),score=63.56 TRINITY_DN9091_c0_g1_i1:32-1474(+)
MREWMNGGWVVLCVLVWSSGVLGQQGLRQVFIQGDGSNLPNLFHIHAQQQQVETQIQTTKMYYGLYLGCVGNFNLGDEVLADIALRMFTESFTSRGISLALSRFNPHGPHAENVNYEYRISLRSVHFVILGGGSIWGSEYSLIIKEALRRGTPVFAFGTGWDDYTRLLNMDTINKVLDGTFWLSLDTKPWMVELGQAVKFGGLRGPLTRNIAVAGNSKDIKLGDFDVIGDAGMLAMDLFEPDSRLNGDQDLNSWVVANKERYVVVNWAYLNLIYGGLAANDSNNDKKLDLIRSVALVVNSMVRVGYRVLFVPFEMKDISAVDTEIINALNIVAAQYKDVNYTGAVYSIRYVPDIETTLYLFKQARFSICFRLHAAVFSASVGTPFLALGYRSKIFDFVQTLQLREHALNTDAAKDVDALVQKIEFVRRLDRQEFESKCELARETFRNNYRTKIREFLSAIQDKYEKRVIKSASYAPNYIG